MKIARLTIHNIGIIQDTVLEFDKPLEASGDIHNVTGIRMEKWEAVDDPKNQWNSLFVETEDGEVRFSLNPKEVRQDTVVLY